MSEKISRTCSNCDHLVIPFLAIFKKSKKEKQWVFTPKRAAATCRKGHLRDDRDKVKKFYVGAYNSNHEYADYQVAKLCPDFIGE